MQPDEHNLTDAEGRAAVERVERMRGNDSSMPDAPCPPGKFCPHERAFQYALAYFSTDTNEDHRMVSLLTQRYREALRRQRVEVEHG